MIAFFRKIRKRLIQENRITRYLAYAAGEILLVVIGILIALQVNNWNEERKIRNELVTLLRDLYINMSDQQNVDHFVERGLKADSILTMILSDTLDMGDYEKMPFLSRVITDRYYMTEGISSFTYMDETFAKVIGREGHFKEDDRELVNQIKAYVQALDAVDRSSIQLVEQTKLIRDLLLEYNPAYFLEDSVNRVKNYEYLLNDPLYKIHVALYKEKMERMIGIATYIRGHHAKIVAGLLVKLQHAKSEEISAFLAGRDFVPFRKVDCGSSATLAEHPFTDVQFFVIHNTQNEEMEISLENDIGDVATMLVSPAEIRVFSGHAGGFVYAGSTDCSNRYRIDSGGYLKI